MYPATGSTGRMDHLLIISLCLAAVLSAAAPAPCAGVTVP